MFQKANKPLLAISIAIFILILFVGLPENRLSSKNFSKNIISFPTKNIRIAVLALPDPYANSVNVPIPPGYMDYLLFIGDDLENLQAKINAAIEFNKFAGSLNKELSTSSKKVFKSNIKNDQDTFILNNKGELFVRFKKQNPQYLARFGSSYFNELNLKSFAAKAKTIAKVVSNPSSANQRSVFINFQALRELKLDTTKVTIVFSKTVVARSASKRNSAAAPNISPLALELTAKTQSSSSSSSSSSIKSSSSSSSSSRSSSSSSSRSSSSRSSSQASSSTQNSSSPASSSSSSSSSTSSSTSSSDSSGSSDDSSSSIRACCYCHYQESETCQSDTEGFKKDCENWLSGQDGSGLSAQAGCDQDAAEEDKHLIPIKLKPKISEVDGKVKLCITPPEPLTNPGCNTFNYMYAGHGNASTGAHCMNLAMKACIDSSSMPTLTCALGSCSSVADSDAIQKLLEETQDKYPALNWTVSGFPQISYGDTNGLTCNQPVATYKISPTGYSSDLTKCSELLGETCYTNIPPRLPLPRCMDDSVCPPQIKTMTCCTECSNSYNNSGNYQGIWQTEDESCNSQPCQYKKQRNETTGQTDCILNFGSGANECTP